MKIHGRDGAGNNKEASQVNSVIQNYQVKDAYERIEKDTHSKQIARKVNDANARMEKDIGIVKRWQRKLM